MQHTHTHTQSGSHTLTVQGACICARHCHDSGTEGPLWAPMCIAVCVSVCLMPLRCSFTEWRLGEISTAYAKSIYAGINECRGELGLSVLRVYLPAKVGGSARKQKPKKHGDHVKVCVGKYEVSDSEIDPSSDNDSDSE